VVNILIGRQQHVYVHTTAITMDSSRRLLLPIPPVDGSTPEYSLSSLPSVDVGDVGAGAGGFSRTGHSESTCCGEGQLSGGLGNSVRKLVLR
jgi:hypothetical protein